MTIQFSVDTRNAVLDALESTVGTAAKLQIWSGAQPANAAAADTGTLLCEITLPSDWMNAAATGSKTKLGTWSGTGEAAAGAGTSAGHFRLKNNAETTCHMQGSVTVTGGGGDLTLDNVSIASGQSVTVASFTINAPNA